MTGAWSLQFPGEDVVTFSDDTGVFMRQFPELQQYDVADQDVDADGVDGTQFGSDTISGATFGISFGVTGSDEYETRDREGELKAMWRGDQVRRSPDAVAELISDRGRSSFGRPRRIATSAARYHEYPPQADVNAEWKAADPLWYGQARVASVGLVPTPSGGLQAPLVAPLTVGNGPSTRSTEFTVVTDARSKVKTPPLIRITGPIINPVVKVIGATRTFTFAFPMTLAYDDEILIRTVSWNSGAIRKNSGGLVPLGPGSSRFGDALLEGGTYELILTGTAPTGSPRAFIEWRDAHTTP